ncbi:anti-sigma-F factor Fin family protein [Terrilactibacillus sp. S3-3]|nr:anti-sigma-F factor Fin family protein [Terrilactibacillus sp. S3-3]
MMVIVYKCRHCGTKVGELAIDTIQNGKLGLDRLTIQELQEMVQFDNDNGTLEILTICEDCQEALTKNPEFHQWDTFIQ